MELPCQKCKKDPADADGHPVSGSAEHHALYGTFHHHNTKDYRDSLSLVKLCDWLNSQVAKQLFSEIRKNNYFMNLLSPTSHIFLIRNILHHRNKHINQKALQELTKLSYGNVIVAATKLEKPLLVLIFIVPHITICTVIQLTVKKGFNDILYLQLQRMYCLYCFHVTSVNECFLQY